MDYNVEKKYLEKVLYYLNEKINEYIEKRKEISDIIVDYRKKFIEEYRDDDDKAIDYFDHENYKNEKIFMTIERRIKELLYLKKNPYFGKIIIEDEGDIEEYYIGSYGLDAGFYNPLIVDWRAPISSLFYDGGKGIMSYKVPSSEVIEVNLLDRIQFLIKNEEIISMFNSDTYIKDDFLKEILSLKASDKLKSIVSTIQKNQDKVIREGKNKSIIINGVAGSGKTSIALHRVAYLLYNFRDYFMNKVLILGPNKIFMDYISKVLPTLGEYGGFFYSSVEDFIYLSMDREINFISYDAHMEKILKDKEYKEEFIFKGSSKMKEEIHKFLKYVEDNINFGSDLYFRDELVITLDEITNLFYNSYKSRSLSTRLYLIRKKILGRVNKIRNRFVYEIKNKYKDLKVDDDLRNHYDMLERNEIYDVIRDASFIKSSLHYLNLESPYDLYREFYEEYFYKDLTNLDFSDLLIIKYIDLLTYDVKRDRDYKLVIIDEAQDFSPMFYEVINLLTKSPNYLILGDINQSIIKFDESFIKGCDFLKDPLYIEMKDSYRSTENIINYASKYMENKIEVSSIRKGEEVIYEEIKEDLLKDTLSKYLTEDISIGIIVLNKEMLNKVYSLINNRYIKIIDSEDQVYSDSGIFLTTIYLSKGLEFDSVIVIDNDIPSNLLYIMLTRAMHKGVHIKLKM